MVSWTGLVGGISALVIVRWLYHISKWQKAHQEGEWTIFPVANVFQWYGLFLFMASMLLVGFGVVNNAPLWFYVLFGLTALVGPIVGQGEIRINHQGIEQRILWMQKFLDWNEIYGIDTKTYGRDDPSMRAFTVLGETRKIKFSTWHTDYERLVEEIKQRSPNIPSDPPLSMSPD